MKEMKEMKEMKIMKASLRLAFNVLIVFLSFIFETVDYLSIEYLAAKV